LTPNNQVKSKKTQHSLLTHFVKLFLPVATLLMAGTFSSYRLDESTIHHNLSNHSKISLHSAIAATQNSLNQVNSDLRYLAHCEALKTAIDENSATSTTKLASDWVIFSDFKQIYDQIRWIDETGRERVRINYHPDQSIIVPPQELQDKAKRYYFHDIMMLGRDDIFMSPFDLNIENEQIEIPWKPTIRFGLRVFDSAGRARGFVVLNYLGNQLLDRLRSLNDAGLWMTNQQGYWLLGPHASAEWGFMFNKPELTIKQHYSEAWSQIVSQDHANFETADGYWRFQTIVTDIPTAANPVGGFDTWKLIHFQPIDTYEQARLKIQFRYGIFTASLLLGLAVAAWLLARSRHTEIKALSDAADAYRAKQEIEHAHVEAMAKQTEQLRQAVEASDQASRAKSEFVANMSHEIRTPINAILGLVYLLEQQELMPTMRCMVTQIGVAGKSLLGIINDILDFSKIEANRIVIEQTPFRLSNVLDNLAGIMSTTLGEKTVEIVISPVPPDCDELIGDPLRLSQILINLTTNAIKFTDKGEVAVTISRSTHEGPPNHARLRFGVRDTGIGIAPGKQQQIFEAFSQSDNSTSRQFGGSGLGLTISRHLVNLMGGELLLSSQLGIGSEFYFEVNFEMSTQCSAPEIPKYRILIADDNSIARKALSDAATSLGWHVDTVDSGAKAIETVRDNKTSPYDILLLDWRMPDGDGISTATSILETCPDPDALSIIIMATAYDRELLQKQSDIGIVDVLLSKPVTVSGLYNAVTEAKGQHQQRQEETNETPENILGDIRILVVDDSEINREIAREILSYHGARVKVATHGGEALNMLKVQPDQFDIILMDVQMPVMDGYTATREIRAIPGLNKLPIVALTAGAYKIHQLAAFDSGMDEYVSKPFDVDELLEVISRLTQHKISPSADLD